MKRDRKFTLLEVCAGAGGQAVGLEQAGFEHLACVEIDTHACETLRENRPNWHVVQADITTWEPPKNLKGVSLLAGGVPCPPFSIAGKQLGPMDERDLFPVVLRLAEDLEPKAVLIENVKGIFSTKFDAYRERICSKLEELGYTICGWRLLNSRDFGVPQSRARAILVAMHPAAAQKFLWPRGVSRPVSVGEALEELMGSRGWAGAKQWAQVAAKPAPALVGGSKLHGGPDLGPTRARLEWKKLGVDGGSLAEEAPESDFNGVPRLTVPMAAAIQGFPREWKFVGKKTAAYRQVGNAFPPPVARSVGCAIRRALESVSQRDASALKRRKMFLFPGTNA